MSDLAPQAESPPTADAAIEGNALLSHQQSGQATEGSVGPTSARPEGGVQPSQESAPEVPAAEAPKPTAKRLFESMEQAEKDYKALQAAWTRDRQALAKLGVSPNEAAEALAFVAELRNDPSFREWGEKELAKRTAGGEDPQTLEALRIVREEARRIAEEEVAPLKQQALQGKITNTFMQMDQKYGPEWRQYKEVMGHLVQHGIDNKWFPPDIDQHFSLPFIDGIYRMVATADPEYVPKTYEKMLKAKQAKSTSSAAGAPAGSVSVGPVKTFEDAAREARKQLGV